MSMDDCIRATAKELGISEADAREIADRIDGFRKRQAAEGRLDRAEAAVRQFAQAEADKARIAAALARKQAALNVLVRDRVDKWIDGQVGRGVPLQEAIVSYLVGGPFARDSISARRAALEGDWIAGMLAEAAEKVPIAFNMLKARPADAKPFFDDVVREMVELREGGTPGKTGNKDARELAGIFARHAEASRLEANKAGTNIGRLDGWAGPQAHDERKLLNADPDRAKRGQAWVDFTLGLLDLERSFGAGITPAEARSILGEVYLNIVTGRGTEISARQKGERLGPANLARSMEQHRVLHFKDADAWIAYNDRFGRGNVATAMLGHLNSAARKVSLMQLLGPNPEVMLGSILEARGRAERLNAAGREEEVRKLEQQLAFGTGFRGTKIGKAWATVSGDVNIPTSVSAARIGANVRAGITQAKLGASLLSQFSDLGTFGAGMSDQGRGVLQGQADALKALFAGGGELAAQRARLIGIGADSWLGDVHARFNVDGSPTGFMARATAAFYRLSGVKWWSERLEAAYANMTSAWMAEKAKLSHAELDGAYQHVLGLHGISAERWEVVRQAVEKAEDGNRYVMPDKVADLPDEAFRGLVVEQMQDAEDALRERVGAQTEGRRQTAVTRQQQRVERATTALQEAQDKLRASQSAGDRRGLYNHGRSVEARQRRLDTATEAHRQASERLKATQAGPVRELTLAEQVGLDERRTRLVATARRELELDLRSFFADEAGHGVLKGDDRTRMFWTQGIPPGNALGEALRFVGQFQMFTAAYIQRRLGRSFRGYAGADPSAGFLRGIGTGAVKNLPAIATLIAASTVYGYISRQAKNAIKNRSPEDPTRVATWMASLVQGGGLGLFGDYIFGQYDRFGGGISSRLIGPGPGEAVNLFELWQKARAGDAKAGDFINLALNNAPFINLFYVRAALDLAVLNQLQEWASPGVFGRRQRTVLSQFGQHYLINPTPLAGHRPAGVSP